MDPILGLAEAHGVYLADIALSPRAWDRLGEAIRQLPYPGELRFTHPKNMIDYKTRRRINGIQIEAGVSGWEVYTNGEDDSQTALITPADWYSAQFRIANSDSVLPHFLEYNGGASAIQYHWIAERTFMDPPVQNTLPKVDLLERSGTWVKTRYQLGEDGIYRPSMVAVDLEYDSNGLTPQMARDQIRARNRIVFDLNEMTYNSANGNASNNRSSSLNEGYTVVQRDSSSDTYRNPRRVHLFVTTGREEICLRINPDNSLWQTDLTIPYGINIPDYPGSIEEIDKETLDNWVDQHRNML